MLVDELDYVIGLDTHLDEHFLAVVVARSDALAAGRSVRVTARGYAAALRFAVEVTVWRWARSLPRRPWRNSARGQPP